MSAISKWTKIRSCTIYKEAARECQYQGDLRMHHRRTLETSDRSKMSASPKAKFVECADLRTITTGAKPDDHFPRWNVASARAQNEILGELFLVLVGEFANEKLMEGLKAFSRLMKPESDGIMSSVAVTGFSRASNDRFTNRNHH